MGVLVCACALAQDTSQYANEVSPDAPKTVVKRHGFLGGILLGSLLARPRYGGYHYGNPYYGGYGYPYGGYGRYPYYG